MREEVKWFAGKMESVLQIHDYKGGWIGSDNFTLEDAIQRLLDEVSELQECFHPHRFCKSCNCRTGELTAIDDEIENAINESIDVANFAMMIADKLRKGDYPREKP